MQILPIHYLEYWVPWLEHVIVYETIYFCRVISTRSVVLYVFPVFNAQ